MIDSGWYVLTILLVAVAFLAGWFVGDKPRYRYRPEPKGDYCPGFWERLYYQQHMKARPVHEMEADGRALHEFIKKLEKIEP
jgi:hypothetical protein